MMITSAILLSTVLSLTPRPNPPEPGENTLELVIRDESGKPIDDAKVSALVSMPAMGTMPYMEEKSEVVAKGGGAYAVSFDLSMGGTWDVAVTVETKSSQQTSRYSLTTGIPGIASRDPGPSIGSGGAAGIAAGANTIAFGAQRLQRIGVRFAEAKVIPILQTIESVGVVEQDSSQRESVTVRFSGYVAKQLRGRIGDTVKAQEPLMSIYSPELVTAQSELLLADKLGGSGPSLHAAAAERLKNLGLSERDLAEIRKSGAPKREIFVRAPSAGTILDISVREGASVTAGQVAYVIGDLSKSFIIARVAQRDANGLAIGQDARIRISGSDTAPLSGKITLVYPEVELGSGTTNVRVEVPDQPPQLKPGAFADVDFTVDLGPRLAVPAEAVLYSGKHRYVFVDRGDGHLEPVEVEVAQTVGDFAIVQSGIKEGERIAASGTFLLSSEAQLRSALPKWTKSGSP